MRISDWSSDVCSSDLRGFSLAPIAGLMRAADPSLDVFVSVSHQSAHYNGPTDTWVDGAGLEPDDKDGYLQWVREMIAGHEKIGRASCRERECQYVSISVVAVSLKKKQKNH